jgi:hypothetical protein
MVLVASRFGSHFSILLDLAVRHLMLALAAWAEMVAMVPVAVEAEVERQEVEAETAATA